MAFPGGAGSKEPACQCNKHKRHRFNPCIGKISWSRAWQPTPVFLPGESPWTQEPGGLWSIGLKRVRHNGGDLAQCIYMDSRKMVAVSLFTGQEQRFRHKENCGYSGGGKAQAELREQHKNITLPCGKQIVGGKLLYNARSSAQCSVMTQRNGMGESGREAWEAGDMCIFIDDSHCCKAETNTAL